MVKLLFTRIDHPREDSDFRAYLNQVPAALQRRIERHTRWQDAHAGLFGKLLLQRGLSGTGHGGLTLHDLQYTARGRPFVAGGIDFNISHAGALVLCALSDKCRVGVDIEEIKPVSLAGFRPHCTHREWERIVNAPDPCAQFYHYWTRKEALLKAAGTGIRLPLRQIEVTEDRTFFEGGWWYLHALSIAGTHVAHLATDREITSGIHVEAVTFP